MFDGGHIDPVLAGKADGGHLGLGCLQLLLDAGGGLQGTHALKVARIADFDPVVVDPKVNEAGGPAANDDLVVAGMFELRPEKPAEQGVRITVRLGRKGVDGGAVGADDRRGVQEARAEDEQVVRRKGFDFRRDPVPQNLSAGALTPQVEPGQFRVGFFSFDVAPGQVDLQVESGFSVPHLMPISRARIPAKVRRTRGIRSKRRPPGDTRWGTARSIPCSHCSPWRRFPE